MKPYKPSQTVPVSGLFWLTLSSVLGGAVVGGVTSVISSFIYLIILFPLFMGCFSGIINMIGIKQGKVRNPFVGIIFGVLTGLSI